MNDLISAFHQQVEMMPFLQDIQAHMAVVFEKTRGPGMNVEFIEKYLQFFSGHIEDTYEYTKSQRRGDVAALAVCQFICRAYEGCLADKPSVYKEDRIGQSGNVRDGTPYERVCSAVEIRFKINLPWATRVKAVKTYTR